MNFRLLGNWGGNFGEKWQRQFSLFFLQNTKVTILVVGCIVNFKF